MFAISGCFKAGRGQAYDKIPVSFFKSHEKIQKVSSKDVDGLNKVVDEKDGALVELSVIFKSDFFK